MVVRTNKFKKRKDGSLFFFFNNNTILLKKRTASYGKRMIGAILKEIRRKKIIISFKKIL
jgi:ribosomal protein L14